MASSRELTHFRVYSTSRTSHTVAAVRANASPINAGNPHTRVATRQPFPRPPRPRTIPNKVAETTGRVKRATVDPDGPTLSSWVFRMGLRSGALRRG
jgi:hypothetical protein